MVFRRLFACVPALLLVLTACQGGEGGGSLEVARGFSLIGIRPEDRTPAPALARELPTLSWEWVRREDEPDLFPETKVTSAELDQMLAGKVAVVNFWGSWCGPCRDEQEGLEMLWREYREHHGDHVMFLGVNTRRDQYTAAMRYLEEFDVTYPSVYNPDSRIAFEYLVRFMPATFVLDKQGRLAARIVGAVRNEVELRKLLDAELAR